MCDYSLQSVKSRPAAVGDKLTVHDFGSTYGLSDGNKEEGFAATAVCLLPGTEVAFDEPVKRYACSPNGTWRSCEVVPLKSTTGIFCQMDKENIHTHHDAFEFSEDHDRVLINLLVAGQRVTVLQLPVTPETVKKSVEEMDRLEVVG